MSENPYLLLVVTSMVLGLGAGFVMHRSDFCIAGMFRDYFLFRSRFMLSMLLVAVALSMGGFELARLLGVLPPQPFPLLGAPALTNVAGGALFGLGMVLAGGCVVGTLYKLGSGSILSLAALVGLVAGSALYADVHPWWSRLSAATTLPGRHVTLAQMLGVSHGLLTLAVLAPAGWLLARELGGGRWRRRAAPEGYVQPLHAAVVLSAIGLISYLIVGMPLGVTTSYAKIGALLESLFAPERVAGLAYFQAEALHYTPPFAEAAISGGAGPHLDAIAAIQFPLIGGIVLGAAASALLLREFHVYLRVPANQYASALAGGLIMGLASRMAPACNVWHLLGGLPILAGQSLLFVLGLFPGAWLGSRIVAGLVVRRAPVRRALT